MITLMQRTKTKTVFKYIKYLTTKACHKKGVEMITVHVLGAGGGYHAPSILVHSRSKNNPSLFFNITETANRGYACLFKEIPNSRYFFMTRNSVKNVRGLIPRKYVMDMTNDNRKDGYKDEPEKEKDVLQGPRKLLDTYVRRFMRQEEEDSDLKIQHLDSKTINASPFQIDHVVMNPSRRHFGKDSSKNSTSKQVTDDSSVAYIVKTVFDQDDEGQKIVVLECPSMEHLDELLLSERIQSCFSSPQTRLDKEVPELVVHITEMDIVNHEKYQSFMNRFGSKTRHLLLHSKTNPSYHRAILQYYAGLNLLNESLFPELLPGISESSYYSTSDLSSQVVHAENGMMYQLQPFTTQKFAMNKEDLRMIREKIWKVKKKWLSDLISIESNNRKLNDASTFPEIVFLGTSAGKATVGRNTAGILVNVNETSSILLDCGPGVTAQLYQFYGSEFYGALTKIKALFISHGHHDHFRGLYTFLEERKKAYEKIGKEYEKLFVLTHHYLISRGHLESELAGFAVDDLYRSILPKSKAPQSFETATGLSRVVPVKVCHTNDSYGIVLHFKNGKKVVYSGDTEKCPALIKEGMHCDLLIHECTFHDENVNKARESLHCTISDAMEVSEKMRSKFTLLTHFQLWNSNMIPEYRKDVFRAADFMRVTLNDLPKVKKLQDGLGVIFRKDIEWHNYKRATAQLKNLRAEGC